jgi:hypothetical protein
MLAVYSLVGNDDTVGVGIERDSDTAPCGYSRMWVRELALRGSGEAVH